MTFGIDRHPHEHRVALLAADLGLLVNLLHVAAMPGAGVGGHDVIDLQFTPGLLGLRRGPVDVADAVVGHVHLELPRAGLVGNAHQHLPLLDRAEDEPVANLPGDDHAVDRAPYQQILLLHLVELPLLLEALDLPLQLGGPARHANLFVGRDFMVFEEGAAGRDELLLARGLAAEHVAERDLEIGVAEGGEQLPLLHFGAMLEAGLEPLDHALNLRKDIAAVHRLERALPLEPQVGRHEHERQDGSHGRQGREDRAGQIPRRGEHPRLAEQVQNAVEGQARVDERVGDRHLAVLSHQLHPRPLAAIERAR